MERIVVFQTYYNPIEANIIKERLIDSGIQCFLTDENIITLNPLYNQALGGVKLHLFADDVVKATTILQDSNVQNDLALEVEAFDDQLNTVSDKMQSGEPCPNCGSINVGYVQATKNRFSIITIFFSLLLMIYPFKVKKINHCYECGNEFKT